jgi:hypothetical protein
MSATDLHPSAAVAASLRTRDLLWVIRRRHRAAFWLSIAAVIVAVIGMAFVDLRLRGLDACRSSEPSETCARLYGQRIALAHYWLLSLHWIPAVISTFSVATMFPREYEQGTFVLAATSSVTKGRWLRVQVVACLAWTGTVAAALVLAAMPLRETMLQHPDYSAMTPWSGTTVFSGWLIVPYAVSATAVALLCGSLLRRTLPALAAAALVAAVLGLGVTNALPRWQAPLDATWSLNISATPAAVPIGALQLGEGYLQNGHTVAVPDACISAYSTAKGPKGDKALSECLHNQGIQHQAYAYQPKSRLVPFELLDTGALLLIAAGAVLGTSLLMRRELPAG